MKAINRISSIISFSGVAAGDVSRPLGDPFRRAHALTY